MLTIARPRGLRAACLSLHLALFTLSLFPALCTLLETSSNPHPTESAGEVAP